MHTLTLEISDGAIDKFYWLLEHFKDEAKVVNSSVIEIQADKNAYKKAKKEQKNGQTISFEAMKLKRANA